MKRKAIMGIIVIILFIIAFQIYSESNTNLKNEEFINIGNENFLIPEGYTIIDNNQSNGITNNKTSIFLNYTNNTNINESIQEYIKEKGDTPVTITKLNLSNIELYKSNLGNNTEFYHYWFVKNGKTFKISTVSADQNIDYIIFELLKYIEN